MRVLPIAALALCAFVLVAPGAAGAQVQAAAGRGSVEGTARDAAGNPVALAEVTTGSLRAVTDSTGRFRFPNLAAGRATLQTRRLGYRLLTTVVEVVAGETVEASLVLMPLPQNLEPVVVTARLRPGAARIKAFYERRARGNGYFLTREQLEPFDNGALTDALRSRVPSVHVSGGMGRSRLRLRNQRCAPLVWIDGSAATAGEFDIDVLATNTIAAVEVYPGPATVPVEFRTPFGRDGCGGAIVIWSRSDLRDATDEASERRNQKRREDAAKDVEAVAVPVYHADEVDVAAAVDSARLASPVYPDSLFAFGVNGSVTAEFVVDTTGRPMLETFGVVTATHPAFAESVRRAVAASRFTPAQKGGRRVRQVMLLPFKFFEKQE